MDENASRKEDKESEDVTWNKFDEFLALLAGFYAISGSISVFVIMNWLGLANAVIDAMGPFNIVAQVILAILSLFLNVMFMGFLLLNAERTVNNLNLV